MLRTHRSLKASCATLWWRWKNDLFFFIFPCNGAPVEWNWQGKTEVSTTNPTWTDPGSNPSLRDGRPATYRLSHCTANSRSLRLKCSNSHQTQGKITVLNILTFQTRRLYITTLQSPAATLRQRWASTWLQLQSPPTTIPSQTRPSLVNPACRFASSVPFLSVIHNSKSSLLSLSVCLHHSILYLFGYQMPPLTSLSFHCHYLSLLHPTASI
jgi:hypothetical protein